ncbi:succinate--CoA ligase subunit alpha [bacterium]|nr:succinate--CoA ligase subunit alpha [bacterium]
MAVLIDKTDKVIVQGMTGREGRTRTKLMLGYGTNVVGGVTPGRGGEVVEGLPVWDSVLEAQDAAGPINTSVLFIPAPLVKSAAIEAFTAGVKLIVIVPDRVPLHDVMEIKAAAVEYDADFLGPNTLGTLSPGVGVLGMMGGSAESARKFFKSGTVGVSSRSGGITSSIAYYLGKAGIGVSSIVHVGGDPIVGLPHPEVLRRFESDPDTKAVVMFGEIGGTQEEDAAELIESSGFTKPLIAYIGGKGAREGTRFSHAGAIIEGGRGTYQGKIDALKAAGAAIAPTYDAIPEVTIQVLKDRGIGIS